MGLEADENEIGDSVENYFEINEYGKSCVLPLTKPASTCKGPRRTLGSHHPTKQRNHSWYILEIVHVSVRVNNGCKNKPNLNCHYHGDYHKRREECRIIIMLILQFLYFNLIVWLECFVIIKSKDNLFLINNIQVFSLFFIYINK